MGGMGTGQLQLPDALADGRGARRAARLGRPAAGERHEPAVARPGLRRGLGEALHVHRAAERAADDPGRPAPGPVARVPRPDRRRAAAFAVWPGQADHELALDVRARQDVRHRRLDAGARRHRARGARAARGAPPALARRMSATLGIAIERLSKSFGAVQALADIELQVKAGAPTATLGPHCLGATAALAYADIP